MGFNSIFTYLTEYMFYYKVYCLPRGTGNRGIFCNKNAGFCLNSNHIHQYPAITVIEQ